MLLTTDPSAGTDPKIVTDERAHMLAQHAIFVQGGYTTPENERVRAERDIAAGTVPDWDRMQNEVAEALIARVKALPTMPPAPTAGPSAPAPAADPEPEPEATPQAVNVTAVMADIDAAIGLRARIKAMQAALKDHEQMIKDVLGPAVQGVDAAGNVVVQAPIRNRSNLVAAEVKKRLSEEEYARCVNVTQYRPLLFAGDK